MEFGMEGYPVGIFLNRPIEDFFCALCKKVLRDPKSCVRGHTFCSSCIQPIVNTNGNCPTCQTAIRVNNMAINLNARNFILRLPSLCKHCEWQGPLSERDAHMNACPKREVNCPHCNSIVAFNCLKNHIADCEHVPVRCEICRMEVKRKHIDRHNSMCSEVIVECPLIKLCGCCGNSYCEGIMTRSELTAHISNIQCIKLLCEHSNRVSLLESRIHAKKDMLFQYCSQPVTNYPIDRGDFSGNYNGTMSEGMRCGEGTMQYTAGDLKGCLYSGQWMDDLKWGRGTFTYFNCQVYEGEWANDQKQGIGTHQWKPSLYTVGGKPETVQWIDGIQWTKRSMYVGEWRLNKMHGRGKMTYLNGSVYEGQWEEDARTGWGKLTYSNGDVFEGDWTVQTTNTDDRVEFQDGRKVFDDSEASIKQGQGKITFANGEIYEGEWFKDEPQGPGKFTCTNGLRISGIFHGYALSEGIITYTDGGVYEGPIAFNRTNGSISVKREGHGKMTFAEGSIFEGEWKDDKRHGQGKLVTTNGDVYNGSWNCNFKQGQGLMSWKNGDEYTGSWSKDQRQGSGTLSYSDRSTYVGNWQGDKRHGVGTLTWINGQCYIGEWSSDKLCGKGKLTSVDGSVFEGQWRDGTKEGVGTLTVRSGAVIMGQWKSDNLTGVPKCRYPNGNEYSGNILEVGGAGVLTDVVPHGSGTMKYFNNASGFESYTGQWVNNEIEGVGIMVYKDRSKYEGSWRADQRHGPGVLKHEDGRVEKGNWIDNKISKRLPSLFYISK